jgi:branched-chain amino acid transport system permease protein
MTTSMPHDEPLATGLSSRLAIRSMRVKGLIVAPVVVALLVVAAQFVSSTMALKLTLWISFAICALSLDFVWGKAGIFSFGQNAVFGLGGYAYAVIALNFFPSSQETISALLGAGIAGAVSSTLLGYFLFYGRLSDVYLSIVTLAVTLIIYTVLASTAGPEYHVGDALLGGFNGIPSLPGIAFPALFGFGDEELSICQLLTFAIVFAGAIYLSLDVLVYSRFGLKIEGLRSNELRMELLGYDVRKLKLMAFAIGGLIAGLGGGLFAAWGTFVNPSVFSLAQAATVVVWVMVGGRGSLLGAFVGVLIVQSAADAADLVVTQQTPLLVGVLLVGVVMLMPDGVVPTFTRWIMPDRSRQREFRVKLPAPNQAVGNEAPDRRLSVSDIAKHFGGVHVLRGISAAFGESPINAIIGPNGAGKSTFFNILTGRHVPDRGRVVLNGSDVSRLSTFQRCRRGLGIKMQVPCIFSDLTVRENMQLAALISKDAQDIGGVLQRVGLSHRAYDVARTLSHGEQQWLEIALLLVQNPSVLLLDEPGAGMGDEDKRRTIALIHSLSKQHTLIVVEHDMEFIRTLAAPVLMLHQGVVFRSGTFEELVRDDAVIDAYLGRRSHAG